MTAPNGSSCTRERKKTKQGTHNSNTNNRLNSKPRKETEDKHSLYGKKKIENESAKPEYKTSIF
jgi:hypothetical protein